MLLMIDNYDSFTYNIVQYFGELGAEVEVFRNDEITLEGVEGLKPARIVVSPGPCTPKEAAISVPAIQHFAGKLPILGICRGIQVLNVACGGSLVQDIPSQIAQAVAHDLDVPPNLPWTLAHPISPASRCGATPTRSCFGSSRMESASPECRLSVASRHRIMFGIS